MPGSNVPLYPAKGGFRINERLPIGLRTKIKLKFNDAGYPRKGGAVSINVRDATPLYQGLPGQGEISSSSKGVKCGFETLKHGDVCGTEDAEYVVKLPDQFRHCNRIDCPVCWAHYCREHARTTSTIVWDTRDKLAREGYTPMAYHAVVSLPQPIQREGEDLSTALDNYYKVSTLEGWKDLRAEVHHIFKELGALGGVMFYHPFRENGKDGIKNGYITGNDGDPEHWRLAPHFHIIIIFDGFPPLDRIKDLYEKTGFVINFKTPKDERPKGADYLDEARIKTLADCSYLTNYLYSHIGVIKAEGAKRRLPSVTYLENSHPTKLRTLYLRQGVPLLLQGYTARARTPDNSETDGQVLYWRRLIQELSEHTDLSPGEILRLSEVERVNSGFVRCASYDYDYCFGVLDEEYKRQKDAGLLHPVGNGHYDFDVAELWRLIRDDPAFITQFEPLDEELRNPRILQVDGEQLLYLFGSPPDLYEDTPEYSAYCLEADRRARELEEELRASREKYRIRPDSQLSDNPPEGAGEGPAIGGASPSGNDGRRDP